MSVTLTSHSTHADADRDTFGKQCSQILSAHIELWFAVYARYPSVILPGFLYLGDWADAQQHDRLKEIGLKR